MKKILVAVIATFSVVSYAKSYGPAGCGFGTGILSDKTGPVMNVLAATLNGSSGNQTFGMSSGTSGCEVTGDTKVAAVNFIEGNKVALAKDAALGNGEALSALAQIYRCSDVELFGTTIQKNYDSIFKNADSDQINTRLSEVVITEKACV